MATAEPQQTRAPGTPEGVHGAELDQLRRFRELVERSEEGIVELDADRRVTYVNDRMAALLGQPTSTLLGQVIDELIDPEQLRAEHGWSASLNDTDAEVVRGELTLPATPARAKPRTLQVAAHAHRRDGVLHRITAVLTDVTERQQRVEQLERAREELHRSEEVLSRVLRATNDGWWDVDLVADTAFHSERWWQIHGYEPGELPDTVTIARELTHPDELPRLRSELDRVVAERRPSFTTRSLVRHRDGHLVPVKIHGVVDYDDTGVPVRVSGALTDITDLVATQRLQEEFVSTVSHELRTPLTAIGGALESLAGGVAGELQRPARSLVDMGLRNTARLRSLIDDLLDMESLLHPRSDPAATIEDLTLAVHEAVELHRGLTAAHGVRFTITAHPASVLRVHLDPRRLQQIVGNYLSNAAKYAPPGSTVEITVEQRGACARVAVIDTGPGVPHGFEHRAFQRFAQADPSDPRSRGGTGLGLAITREIAERAGGEVGYRSRPGHTSFHVDLPLAAPQEP